MIQRNLTLAIYIASSMSTTVLASTRLQTIYHVGEKDGWIKVLLRKIDRV